MGKLMTPDEAADRARARAEKLAADRQARKDARAAAKLLGKQRAKLFAEACSQAARAFRAGKHEDARYALQGAQDVLSRAGESQGT